MLGLYAVGSLASGDYRPACSDLDLVAVVAEELDEPRRGQLEALHQGLRRREPAASKLHCMYVPRADVGDVGAQHLTWAHGELYRREFSGIARAELHRDGITVPGPEPAQLVPPIDDAALRTAARAELTGHWSGAVRKPWLWLQDGYVDLGLLTLARAEATLTDGRLMTKREALSRLHRFGVDQELSQQIAGRREGRAAHLTRVQQVRRARTARRLVADGIRTLTQLG